MTQAFVPPWGPFFVGVLHVIVWGTITNFQVCKWHAISWGPRNLAQGLQRSLNTGADTVKALLAQAGARSAQG